MKELQSRGIFVFSVIGLLQNPATTTHKIRGNLVKGYHIYHLILNTTMVSVVLKPVGLQTLFLQPPLTLQFNTNDVLY